MATFDKDRLILDVIERIKYDIEKHCPKDSKALQLVNDLLYHFAFKLADRERKDANPH